jgi:hypothetical protein
LVVLAILVAASLLQVPTLRSEAEVIVSQRKTTEILLGAPRDEAPIGVGGAREDYLAPSRPCAVPPHMGGEGGANE